MKLFLCTAVLILQAVTGGHSVQGGHGVTSSASTSGPPSVSGLQAWYKADSLTQANNSGVASWPDSSGNGHTMVQATSGSQPIYLTSQINGLPAISFNGSQFVKTATVVPYSGSGVTVFVVYTSVGFGTGSILTGSASYTTYLSDRISVDQGGGNFAWQFGTFGATVTFALSSHAAGWLQNNVVSDGTTVSFRAQRAALTNSGGNVNLSGDGNAGFDQLMVDTQGNGTAGTFAEIIVYGRNLNSTEVTTIETYLFGKYGV